VSMELVPESYCLIVALCANVIVQPSFGIEQMSNVTLARTLLVESVQARNNYDFRENSTYMTLLTSWF
jgi:hypothetical protein